MFLIKFIKYKHCCYSFLDPHKKKKRKYKKSQKNIYLEKSKKQIIAIRRGCRST